MTSGGGTVSRGRRAWLFVGAALFTVLGVLNLRDGDTVLGCVQLAFAGLTAAAAVSSRVASFWLGPVFRRKRPADR